MTDSQLEARQLYTHLWGHLCRKAEELDRDFNVARNLACSRWKPSLLGGYEPVTIIPEMMVLLRQNFELLETEISRQKYHLTRAFKEILGDDLPRLEGNLENLEYWENENAN